jgi:hypothetical protein
LIALACRKRTGGIKKGLHDMRFRMTSLIAVLFALLCAGCGTVSLGRASPDADLPSQSESYVVLGIEPDYAQVSLFRGWISQGVFHQNPLLPASFVGRPEGGFIVSRSSAGETLAMTYVVISALAPLVPCANTVVVKVPAAKVIYLGNIRFQSLGSGVVPAFSDDLAAAKTFMAAHYPKLADRLERGHFDLMPAVGEGQCVGH